MPPQLRDNGRIGEASRPRPDPGPESLALPVPNPGGQDAGRRRRRSRTRRLARNPADRRHRHWRAGGHLVRPRSPGTGAHGRPEARRAGGPDRHRHPAGAGGGRAERPDHRRRHDPGRGAAVQPQPRRSGVRGSRAPERRLLLGRRDAGPDRSARRHEPPRGGPGAGARSRSQPAAAGTQGGGRNRGVPPGQSRGGATAARRPDGQDRRESGGTRPRAPGGGAVGDRPLPHGDLGALRRAGRQRPGHGRPGRGAGHAARTGLPERSAPGGGPDLPGRTGGARADRRPPRHRARRRTGVRGVGGSGRGRRGPGEPAGHPVPGVSR